MAFFMDCTGLLQENFGKGVYENERDWHKNRAKKCQVGEMIKSLDKVKKEDSASVKLEAVVKTEARRDGSRQMNGVEVKQEAQIEPPAKKSKNNNSSEIIMID